jgi:hypothetical protein
LAIFSPKAGLFGSVASGRLHYMPRFFRRQAIFTSNHPFLTADLQVYTNPLSFFEESVKSGASLNIPLLAGGIFSQIMA